MPVRPWILLLALAFVVSLGPAAGLAQDDPLQASTKTVNVELILDASGSMAETLPDGETRMDAAKRILREVIAGLPERDGVNVGLRVYGHRGDNTAAGKEVSCRASELLVPVAGLNKAALAQQVESIQPTGWTPIAYSLQQAAADFQPGGESITNAIVLVTDGEETCDPPAQSCQAAAALHRSDVTVTTHVVGFALTPEQTDLVRCVAEEGGGQLFGADNAQALSGALDAAIQAAGVSLALPRLTPVPAPGALTDVRSLVYRQLTTWTQGADTSAAQAPMLSADGQWIAFARSAAVADDPANPNRLFIVNAEGSGEREIDAASPPCNCGLLIANSGDGSRVAASDGGTVRIADASGGGGRQLLALDGYEINGVQISTDGNVLIFRVYRDTTIRGTSPSQPLQRGIYAFDLAGGGLRQVVGPDDLAPLFGVAPDQIGFFGANGPGAGLGISADGSRIAFVAFVPTASGAQALGLLGVNGDGSGLHAILTDAAVVVNAAISGDGSRVAYVAADAANVQFAGVSNFDGSGPRVLTDSATIHPGTGYNLTGAERIQLSDDGARLLLGNTGLLYDTNTGQALPLGISVPGGPADVAPLVSDGLIAPTMDASASRVVYLYQPIGQPYQLARLDLNAADPGGAPAIADARVDPDYVLTEGRSTAIVSARVSGDSALWVGTRVLRDGVPDENTAGAALAAEPSGEAAPDRLFRSSAIATNCCAVVGPRTIRVKAENRASDGRQFAAAVDVAPFQVATEPVVATPVATATLPPADAGAQATIAAQATIIATLQAQNGMTTPPTTVATLPPTVPPPPAVTPLVTPVSPVVVTTAAPTAAADALVTPDPSECTVTPRTADSIAALAAAPDRAAADAFAAARARPGLDMQEGAPADAATRTAVAAFYRMMTACFNAGNELAAYALWSDAALRPFPIAAPTTPPTPLPDGERLAFRVTDVRLLPDGRVAVSWEQVSFDLSASLSQLLVVQNGQCLVDETVDIVLPASDEGGAVASPPA